MQASSGSVHLLISADESERHLLEELRRGWPGGQHSTVGPRLVASNADLASVAAPRIIFARQILPAATALTAPSISAWAQQIYEALSQTLAERVPWLLHVEPHFGSGAAGRHRCDLIVESVREKLRRHRRFLLRSWRATPEAFRPAHTLIQVILTAPDQGWLAVTTAPEPHRLRALLSPFPKGEIPVAVDKAAPSRAFAKLLEAEQRLGRRIERGATCVDLGASPGSWTYVALQRGARVTAVDRAALRDDLMRHPGLTFHSGDAFKFAPDRPVDWLLCDVIAAPQRSIALVMDWARRRLARHFVVTIKFKGSEDYAVLEELKQTLPPLCDEFMVTRLCANKNEACAFGCVKTEGSF